MNASPDPKPDSQPSVEGPWLIDGVYYVELRLPRSNTPVRIALHGAATQPQAAEALKTLLALHGNADPASC